MMPRRFPPTLLTLTVEAAPGMDLKEAMALMVDVARRTGCRVQMDGNGTRFWVVPDDTVEMVEAAFDRCYLNGKGLQRQYVATHLGWETKL
jgi:hypothetical protein